MRVLSVLSYGPGAAALEHERGIVSAVLSNGVYLTSESGDLVGLVDSRKSDGPITIRVSELDGALSALEGVAGGRFEGNGLTLNVCGRLEIDMRTAHPWVPPVISLRANQRELFGAIRVLRSIMSEKGDRSGLALLALALPVSLKAKTNLDVTSDTISSDPLLRRAAHALATLEESWQRDDAAGAAISATRLLGLGPGLTPSGDDFLAGLLATFKWLERDSIRAAQMGRSISRAVVSEAPARTTRLSAQLLAHAAGGLLYEPAMNLGAALLAGRTGAIEQTARRLFEIGHTSGTDMAVGVLAGVMLCARDTYP